MANEQPVRYDGVGGYVEAALTAGGTTLTSSALAAMGVVGSTQFAWVILDPDTNPEHVKVTAHTAGATTATILRGQNGTTARSHFVGTPWVHGPVAADFARLVGLKQYNPAADGTVSTTSSTLVDADATNAEVSFVAPPSGRVLHAYSLSARNLTVGAPVQGGIRSASGIIAGSEQRLVVGSELQRTLLEFVEEGLTPGTSYSRRLAFSNGGSGTAELRWGTTNARGPLVMKVWAVDI